MKVIIPLAGLGTRLRPHTHTRPKPLMHLAGKTVLGHILDKLSALKVKEVIFITGHMDDKIKSYVKKNYRYRTKYIRQEKLEGDGAAILLAKNGIKKNDDVLIVFVDTLFKTNLKIAQTTKKDGILWVKEVEDPRRFGVVVVDDGKISKIVEKPNKPISNLALIGMYYFKDAKNVMNRLAELRKKKIKSKGEYRLADAIALMIKQGKDMEPRTVDVWADCGKPETLLETNAYLLKNGKTRKGRSKNSVVIQPVFVEYGAKIENSIIGPNVSVAAGAVIKNSIVSDSIINEHAHVENSNLQHSIVGESAVVHGKRRNLSVGDHSEIR